MGIKMLIGAGTKALVNWLAKNGSMFQISVKDINNWLTENKHPLSLEFDSKTENLILRLVERKD